MMIPKIVTSRVETSPYAHRGTVHHSTEQACERSATAVQACASSFGVQPSAQYPPSQLMAISPGSLPKTAQRPPEYRSCAKSRRKSTTVASVGISSDAFPRGTRRVTEGSQQSQALNLSLLGTWPAARLVGDSQEATRACGEKQDAGYRGEQHVGKGFSRSGNRQLIDGDLTTIEC